MPYGNGSGGAGIPIGGYQGWGPQYGQQAPAQSRGVPNINLLGNTGGTGEPLMPQGLPDYIGQAGDLFNNYQPYDIGQTPNLGGAFDSFQMGQDRLFNSPQVPLNPLITGQQQNQMLNSAIGANAAQRATGVRDATRSLGGRGFTSESPALQATKNRLGLNEALANTQARVDIPMQVSRQNAEHQFRQLGENRANRQADWQNYLGLENARTGRIGPLMSALVGLV